MLTDWKDESYVDPSVNMGFSFLRLGLAPCGDFFYVMGLRCQTYAFDTKMGHASSERIHASCSSDEDDVAVSLDTCCSLSMPLRVQRRQTTSYCALLGIFSPMWVKSK